MIIIEMNPGTKIPYEIDGGRITFDDDLSINLSRREEDWPIHIDVCFDINKALVLGAAAGRAYVAQIDIPARRYEEMTAEINGETAVTRKPIPFDMDVVTLTLWAIE